MLMISVAMITLNGELYIKEQLDSILPQLGPEDELLISDDGSADATLEIIGEYRQKDERIRLEKGPKEGIIANVEAALGKCRGDVIFLSDQDDVWLSDKVSRVMAEFDRGSVLVMHDAKVMNDDLTETIYPSFFSFRGCRSGKWANILKNRYIGSCMAFRRSLVSHFLPIPRSLPMHDQWIGLAADIRKEKITLIREPLMLYRRHEGTGSDFSHHSVPEMIRLRMNLLRELKKARPVMLDKGTG